MKQISNQETAEVLRRVATVLSLDKNNRFRSIAYQNAADSVSVLHVSLADLIKNDNLHDITGIGENIKSHLIELYKTGKSAHFESILKSVPPFMFELMNIPGIGPKTAYKLSTKLHLKNFSDVQKAITNGSIEKLEGFGAKSVSDIQSGIELLKTNNLRMLLGEAQQQVDLISNQLSKITEIERYDFLGSFRRRKETIGDLDCSLLVKPKAQKSVFNSIAKQTWIEKVILRGDKKMSVITHNGLQIDFRIQDKSSYGAQMQYFTGSKEHNIELRKYALKRGYSLSEYGLKNLKTAKMIMCPDEDDVYKHLGLSSISPEIRENRGEIDLALHNKLPNLVNRPDIKGDLHIHTPFHTSTPLDFGISTISEILKVASILKYEYVGFADHSPRLSMKTEMQILSELNRRKEYIAQEAEKYPNIKIFIGLEVDILGDGDLVVSDKILDELDYAIVSIHSGFKQDPDKITSRFIHALRHPKVKIIGHPTGRILNRRPSYYADWSQIFEICQKKNIALEINASPFRLDLPDNLVIEANKAGNIFSINTDSHEAASLYDIKYGVDVARRGFLVKQKVINTYNLSEIKKFLK